MLYDILMHSQSNVSMVEAASTALASDPSIPYASTT